MNSNIEWLLKLAPRKLADDASPAGQVLAVTHQLLLCCPGNTQSPEGELGAKCCSCCPPSFLAQLTSALF